jgi:predicted nuclease of predicted toxin-antitoxin system
VRFLVDEALQDLVADRLLAAGHDATHVRALGMQGAIDDNVLAHAAEEQRVLVTTDTDFGAILALSGASIPSVLLLRGVGDSVDERADAVTRALAVVEHDLARGAIVVIERDRVRLRKLPSTHSPGVDVRRPSECRGIPRVDVATSSSVTAQIWVSCSEYRSLM